LFNIESPPLVVNDITFSSKGDAIIVYIMEETRGIVAFEVSTPFKIKLLIKEIGKLRGG